MRAVSTSPSNFINIFKENKGANLIFDEAMNQIFNILQKSVGEEELLCEISKKQEIFENLKFAFSEKIQSEMQKTILFGKFSRGDYDAVAFGDFPQITKELEILIQNYNREFVLRLFCFSKSMNPLIFWLDESKRAELPKNSLLLAVIMGCNIHVLKYLRNKQEFNELPTIEKQELLIRGKRFSKEDGYQFLLKELDP